MIRPDDLLHFALTLVLDDPGNEACARRAVSAAYYALFHTIARAGAELIQCEPELRRKIVRSYSHKELSAAASALAARAEDPRIVAVARALKRLREARERADYDLDSPFDWDEAARLFWDAHDACEQIASLRSEAAAAPLLLAPFIRRG